MFIANKRDLIFGFFTLILSVFIINFIFWGGMGLGAAGALLLLLVTALFYLLPQKKRVTGYGVFCLAAYGLGAAALGLSDTLWVKILLLPLLLVLSSLAYLEFMDLRSRRGMGALGDLCLTAFALPFGGMGRTCAALLHKPGPDGTPRKRRVGGVLLGLGLSLPLLCLLVPLLIGADAAFEGLMGRIDLSFVLQCLGSLLLGSLVFLLVYTRMFLSPKRLKPQAREPWRGSVGKGVFITLLTVVSLLYLVYLFTQLAYFFSAFRSLLPKEYTVAEYARRGFFEMAALCALNLLLVFLAHFLTRKEAGTLRGLLRALCVFICVFSLVLIAAALSKMFLYMKSYGLTTARMATTLFMFFLAVVFLGAIVRLFAEKMPLLRVAAVAGALLLLAAAVSDLNGVAAEYNVRAYEEGRLETVDTALLEELSRSSAAAVPPLLRLARAEDPAVAEAARNILRESSTCASLMEEGRDWRRQNLASLRAAALLKENRELFREPLSDLSQ